MNMSVACWLRKSWNVSDVCCALQVEPCGGVFLRWVDREPFRGGVCGHEHAGGGEQLVLCQTSSLVSGVAPPAGELRDVIHTPKYTT